MARQSFLNEILGTTVSQSSLTSVFRAKKWRKLVLTPVSVEKVPQLMLAGEQRSGYKQARVS